MANHISKKIKKQNLVLQKVSSEEEEVLKTPEAVLSKSLLTPEQTKIISPEVLLTKSSYEEVRTSDILTHISNTVVNVTMGEGESNQEFPMVTKGNIETSTVSTLVSLPPFIIPTHPILSSPTFTQILNQPFTSLFSSQSTDPPKSIDDTNTDDGGFGVTFDALEFNQEEDIPDHMLMSGKQFRILNKKLNSIIQSQADVRGSNYVSSVDVDVMLKVHEANLFNRFSSQIQDSESRLLEKMDANDKNNELRIKSQSSTFNRKVKDLKTIAKE
ncbi:unnamed protein product [Lactuca saligna]|uniref:Uncharacterized protein n=1 Tax=Lactuca saligna TaxID=75948 RepID=A0AA35VQB5_LACSI|nr:unnamed protein product [Lactuca saligna]